MKVALANVVSEFKVLQGKETPVTINYAKKTIFLASDVGVPIVYEKIPSAAA